MIQFDHLTNRFEHQPTMAADQQRAGGVWPPCARWSLKTLAAPLAWVPKPRVAAMIGDTMTALGHGCQNAGKTLGDVSQRQTTAATSRSLPAVSSSTIRLPGARLRSILVHRCRGVCLPRPSILGVPAEIEASARLGATTWGDMGRRLTRPMVVPALITTATLAVSFTRVDAVTLPVVIAGLSGAQGSNWGQASALAVIATAPIFALGLLVQRHFVRGLTLGAVRG